MPEAEALALHPRRWRRCLVSGLTVTILLVAGAAAGWQIAWWQDQVGRLEAPTFESPAQAIGLPMFDLPTGPPLAFAERMPEVLPEIEVAAEEPDRETPPGMLADELPAPETDPALLAVLDPRDRLIFPVLGSLGAQSPLSPSRAPGPATSRRLGAIASYTVRPGDTLASIAARFGVNVEWVRLANRISPTGVLQAGQPLLVPTLNGPIHVVQAGETLSEIATSYRVDLETITSANELENERVITLGQRLLIPGGVPPPPAQPTRVPAPAPVPTAVAAPIPRPTAALPLAKPQSAPTPAAAPTPTRPAPLALPFGALVWPVVGAVTQRFGENGHSGLDIAASTGAPVRAVGPGTVVVAAKLNYGYGWRIVIDHGGDYTSLYAHLSSFAVAERARVSRGQVIGNVGTTGVATGPHLHFEIGVNGRAVDPMRYLP